MVFLWENDIRTELLKRFFTAMKRPYIGVYLAVLEGIPHLRGGEVTDI
jgi:hypothetical protein